MIMSYCSYSIGGNLTNMLGLEQEAHSIQNNVVCTWILTSDLFKSYFKNLKTRTFPGADFELGCRLGRTLAGGSAGSG